MREITNSRYVSVVLDVPRSRYQSYHKAQLIHNISTPRECKSVEEPKTRSKVVFANEQADLEVQMTSRVLLPWAGAQP